MSVKFSSSNCFHKLINKEYCQKCGAIFYQNEFLSKHIKYNYPCELSPITLCQEMISSNRLIPLNSHSSSKSKTKIYFEKRKEIKTLLKNMNTSLDNNSSTYFLALLYADLIFQNYSLEEIFLSNIIISRYNFSSSSQKIFPVKQCLLIAVCCLIVASKFNEKDPHVPDLNSFIRIYNQNSKFYFIFSLDELRETEVKILKLLKYKLNFYSLYQFITFFFANGILFQKNLSQSNIIKKYKYSDKKILERIYVKSREILDLMIDEYDKYYLLFNGKDNYITAIEILLWAIEQVLDIKIINEKYSYIFPKVYNIDIDISKHEEIYSIINELYNSNNMINENNNNSNTDVSNNINYNFEYGSNLANSDLDLINKYSNINSKENIFNNLNNNKNNNNLFLMSITNFDQIHKNERLPSEFKNKNYKTRYNFRTKYKNNNNITDFFEDTQDISAINKLTTLMSYDKYNKSKVVNDENKNNNIPDENDEIDDNKYPQNKNKYQYNGISRNSINDLNSHRYGENEKNDKNDKNVSYRNYIRNYNEINPYSTKINFGKNHRYNNNNNNIISNSTFTKSWFNKNNKSNKNNNNDNNNNDASISPKNILNKTKKIFDNKMENETKLNNNEENDNFNFLINSYINKSNYAILKSINNEKKEKKDLNENLSESNIIYKLKNNKIKDDRGKENSIIINNNIQINNFNYVGKEHNTYNYYYNSSQTNMNEQENMNTNIDNYFNKKYFNMNNNNKNSNFYLLNKISKLKNKRKVNFKKNNFLGKNNNEDIKEKENSKENKINNNNADYISTIKKMENFKLNKDKNKNFLNLGSFETYFDYGSYSRRKNEESSTKKEYNFLKSINYKNSSYIENNENTFGRGSNNSLLRVNDKFINFNRDLDISERYRKINSEYNM